MVTFNSASRIAAQMALALVVLLVLGACSGSTDSDVVADSARSSAGAASSCQGSAQQIVDRFDEFLAPYNNLTPDEFLSTELEGLDQFQDDIAQTIVTVATDPNDDCTELDLQAEVEVALEQYAGASTLNQYLVGLVRQGTQVETRDVTLSPDDDLIDILSTLGPGSSVTFEEGTFTLDASILVQGDLLFVGAGREETVLESSADTAAFAVLGGGNVVMNNLTVRHVGELPASVLLAVDSSLELVNVQVSGGVVDDEGGGGSGIVLSETEQASATLAVTIDASVVVDNAAAGIAVTGTFAPQITNSVIESNSQCGICYFDAGSGQVQSSTLRNNEVGIQSSDQSSPELSLNMFVDNQVAGLLIEDASTATVISNSFEGIETVAVDVQGTATPVLQRNDVGAHAVGISLRGSSQASVSNNIITSSDIAILIGGSALPVVFENQIDLSQIAGVLHTEQSAGEFTANTVIALDSAGVVVEGEATPEIREAVIEGGLVGLVFREMSSGIVRGAELSGQQVGIEITDQSSPTIESSLIVEATDAGVIFGGETTAMFRENNIEEPVAIGLQTNGASSPLIASNQVIGGDTAILVTDSSAPTITENTMTDQNFGIGVSGQAMPAIEANQITNAVSGALSFEGTASGTAQGNTIVDAGVVGIRIAGQASPVLAANILFAAVSAPETADGETGEQSGAGLLYADQASGTAVNNELFGFVIGIRVGDGAAPDVTANRVDGAGVGGVGVLYSDSGAGTARNNLSIDQQLGFQLSGTASPMLQGNTVENASVAAFLIQGDSTADLSGNDCNTSAVGIVVLEAAAPVLGDNGCVLQQ